MVFKKRYLLVIPIVILLILGLDISGLMWKSFIGPRRENVRREIFEQTKSYQEGKRQDLIRYRLQYLQAEGKEEKEAIASTIRMMFADYDPSNLDDMPELKRFLLNIL